jgi:tetratricopeptide (TPR) repeat protein
MKSMKRSLMLLAVASIGASAQSPQVWMPDGTALRSLPSDSAVTAAAARLAATPDDVTAYIALARAQASVRQMREAVATLTAGLARFPQHAELYRWRGHRHLSLMEFERAQADFDRGLALDSANHGIWYHRGVTHYARGEFDEAITAFQRARPLAPDSLELAGSIDWLWTSLVRAGSADEANRVLRGAPRFRSVSNAYTRRLNLYRGRTSPRRFLTAADTAPAQLATLSFGLATWAVANNQADVASESYRTAARRVGWPTFAYIAGTSDLAAFRERDGPSSDFRQSYSESVRACVASAPDSLFGTTLVQLGVMLTRGQVITPERRRVRDAVARRLRSGVESWRLQVAGTLDTLPRLDAQLGWGERGGEFIVTAFQDGQLKLEANVGRPRWTPGDSAIALMAELVERARAFEDRSLEESARATADSVTLTVYFFEPWQLPSGLDYGALPPTRIVVGAQRSPIESPVAIDRVPNPPRYPLEARELGYEATVITRAVIRADGTADSASFELDGMASPTNPLEVRLLNQFIASSRRALLTSTYKPARIAGCATPQLIQQPFVYQLEGRFYQIPRF